MIKISNLKLDIGGITMLSEEDFKCKYLQQPITLLIEENLDKLETHCRKASKIERGIEHKVVLELLDRYYQYQKELKNKNDRIKKQQEQLETIKEYVHQEVVSYTETIRDYIDDDKEENKDYIGELKELREHWKDIEKILQNKPKEELYMNWWRYGLYE